jgi:hypothetical protein
MSVIGILRQRTFTIRNRGWRNIAYAKLLPLASRAHLRGGLMSKLRLVLCFFGLAGAGAAILSCGSSSQHQLQSITLSPASADGQVQFVVTGYYNTAPLTVAPLPAKWGACYQSSPTTEISINSTGAAQCGIGAAGTYVIWANDPLPDTGIYNCPSTNACGQGCVFSATAQLTCP